MTRCASRRMPAARVLAVLMLGCAGGPARANDSTAELRTGGLVLTQTRDIAMLREDLSISTGEIVVRYVFRNLTDAPVTTTVAFPLPDIDMAVLQRGDVAIPRPSEANFVGFRTRIDGAPVALTIDRKALVKGRDVSGDLARAGVPLAAWTEAARKTVAALPARRTSDFLRKGILADVDGTPEPNWTLRTAFVRTQTFPPGRDVAVEHRYSPSVGESVDTGLKYRGDDPDAAADYRKTYCVDRKVLAEVDALARTVGKDKSLPERRIAYVLKTGSNWAKPIGEFLLTVETDGPQTVLASCFPGLRRIDATHFEVRRSDFSPQADLSLLMIGGR